MIVMLTITIKKVIFCKKKIKTTRMKNNVLYGRMKIDAGLNIYPDGDKNFSIATINHSCHAPVENCYLLLVYLFS